MSIMETIKHKIGIKIVVRPTVIASFIVNQYERQDCPIFQISIHIIPNLPKMADNCTKVAFLPTNNDARRPQHTVLFRADILPIFIPRIHDLLHWV